MKSYIGKAQICLVGKAWEVRHHLRNMLRLENSRELTMLQYLASFNPKDGSGHAPKPLAQPRLLPKKSTDPVERFVPLS